jgi:hypothetical protein
MRNVALLLAVPVIILGGVHLAHRIGRRPGPGDGAPAPGLRVAFPRPGQAVAVLPVNTDPASPAAGRLADELAMSVLTSYRDAHQVTVVRPDGRVLGIRRRGRPQEMPLARSPAALPAEARGGGTARHRNRPTAAEAGTLVDPPAPRSLADRLELPSALRSRLADDDNPVDVVDGLLRAAGHDPDRVGNLLFLDDGGLIVVVLEVSAGSMVQREDLNRSYLQYRNSGARRGLVVAPGYFPSRDTARRQAIDPDLRHVGLRDLQRMADAAAAGMDPLAFALPPHATKGTA